MSESEYKKILDKIGKSSTSLGAFIRASLLDKKIIYVPEVKEVTKELNRDGANLKETKELYNLTEAEEELLSSKRRAQALVMIGSKRMKVNFEIPSYKFNYIGKAGGR